MKVSKTGVVIGRDKNVDSGERRRGVVRNIMCTLAKKFLLTNQCTHKQGQADCPYLLYTLENSSSDVPTSAGTTGEHTVSFSSKTMIVFLLSR